MDKKIKEQLSDLRYELSCVESAIDELEIALENEDGSSPVIYDIDNFTWRLQLDGLLTPELQTFLDTYMRIYNKP